MKEFPNLTNYGYRIIRLLGQNQARETATYLAVDLKEGLKVVVKEFPAAKVNWEIWEQITPILQRLNHSGIPRYFDSFDSPGSLFLVQEYINAPSLAMRRNFKPDEVKEIAASVLTILIYLQKRTPPLIHQNIQPSNVLIDSQNQVYLMDFGCLGQELSNTAFTPPEQKLGQTNRASDLYSLGMTLICLLSGIKGNELHRYFVNPSSPPNLQRLIPNLSSSFLQWLEKLIQPDGGNRYPDAVAALEILKTVEIGTTLLNLEEVVQQASQTKFASQLHKFFTRKETLILLALWLAGGIIWGSSNGVFWLGVGIGMSLGLGLSLFLFTRSNSQSQAGFFSLPSVPALLGAVLIATSVGVFFNPQTFIFYDHKIGLDDWPHNHQFVGKGTGFTLYTDFSPQEEQKQLIPLLEQFRQEVSQKFFNPGKDSCHVDIHLIQDEANFLRSANQFRIKTDFGFFTRRTLRPNLVVIRADSGLGTLTHHAIYHYLVCSLPGGMPNWTAEGMATFVEKFVALEGNDGLKFSWGYRHNWREEELRQVLNSTSLYEVFQSKRVPQSIIRSFFLFLYHQNKLVPLLKEFQGLEGNGSWFNQSLDSLEDIWRKSYGEREDGVKYLESVFQQPLFSIEISWRNWLAKDVFELPSVGLSFAVWGEEATEVRNFLNQYWFWDKPRQMWLNRSGSVVTAIPVLDEIRQQLN